MSEQPKWILVQYGEEWMVCEPYRTTIRHGVVLEYWSVVARFIDDTRALAYLQEQESAAE